MQDPPDLTECPWQALAAATVNPGDDDEDDEDDGNIDPDEDEDIGDDDEEDDEDDPLWAGRAATARRPGCCAAITLGC